MADAESAHILQEEFSIPSTVEKIYPVEQQILSFARSLGYCDDDCFCLRLAMDEAMVNAIIHGNNYDREKTVTVRADCSHHSIAVTVLDEGDGYDINSLNDPTTQENIHATHGRGVFLIRQFMSEVTFNEKGNQITFTLYRSEKKRESA